MTGTICLAAGQLRSTQSSGKNRQRTVWAAAWLIGLGLLAGCTIPGFGGSEPSLNIDYRTYLPQEWTPVGEWQAVSVDDDDQNEWLLFYAYDHGQIGGMILDFQSSVDFVPDQANMEKTTPVPNQPASAAVPYRLLPSYWAETGQGFIDKPNQPTQPQFYSVKRDRAQEIGATSADSGPDELIIRGGNQYVSFFWWRGVLQGYGVAHVSAPGGVNPPGGWDKWDQKSPPRTLQASYPENDRSLLCRKSTYTRQLRASHIENPYRPAIYYQESPRRLDFCQTPPPAHPFYPEAVVLAYLVGTGSVGDLVLPQRAQEISEFVGEFAWVYSLSYYDALVALSSKEPDPAQRTMRVTATLALDEAGKNQRTLRFTLQHQLPVKENPTSDRWQIVNVITAD